MSAAKLADANAALISDTGARLQFAIKTQGLLGLRDNLARFRAIAEQAVAERDALLAAAYGAAEKMRELGSQFPEANCAREFVALREAIKNCGGTL